MSIDRRDFGDVYNTVTERYTGDINRDLSETGIPSDLAIDVAATAAAWATSKNPPQLVSAAIAFHLGAMVGVEWARSRRPMTLRETSSGDPS